MNQLPQEQVMQRAMMARDCEYDGVFFVGVRTTGIFCRPSCPARKPLPRNVEYFPTVREALLYGLRPCKRCRPLDTDGRPPDWVEQILERVEKSPTSRLADADLRSMSVDPSRARRYFNAHFGMTFQAYHRARRMGLALAELRKGTDMLEVAMNHGFDSSSGFRDAFKAVFGDPPGKARGTDCVVTQTIQSPLGRLLMAATKEGICLLEFADRRALETQLKTLRRRIDLPILPGKNGHTEQLIAELGEYFEGKRQDFNVALVYPGTPFQVSVWESLRRIPFGKTISYDRLAGEIGKPKAWRAVGRANGDNRLAILIPCHRVVQKNGQLRGYGGGLWRKQWLLDLESGKQQLIPRLNVDSSSVSPIAPGLQSRHLVGSD